MKEPGHRVQETQPLLHVATMEPRPSRRAKRGGAGRSALVEAVRRAASKAADEFGFVVRFADDAEAESPEENLALRVDSANQSDAVLATRLLTGDVWQPTASEGGYDERSAAWLESNAAFTALRPVRTVAVVDRGGEPLDRHLEGLEALSRGTRMVREGESLERAVFETVRLLRADLDGAQEPAPEPPSEEDPAAEIAPLFAGRWRGAEIWIHRSAEPWALGADASVLFIDHGRGWGSTLLNLLESVGFSHRENLLSQLSDFSTSKDATSRRIESPVGPLLLVHAKSPAWRQVTKESSTAALLEALETADGFQQASVSMPLEDSATFGGVATDLPAFVHDWLERGAARADFRHLRRVMLTVVEADPARVVEAVGRVESASPSGAYRPQAMVNDLPGGPDLLGVEAEVHALAESLALREAQPPLVVGILGGWGWGKSFVLHLLEERLREIRSYRLQELGEGGSGDDEFPYVGHPYVIRFDAWSYAKSNLWASLMRTVLVELDAQVAIERAVVDQLDGSLRVDTELWRSLAGMGDEERRQYLEARAAHDAPVGAGASDGAPGLWAELERLQGDARTGLAQAERELATRRAARDRRLEEERQRLLDEQERGARWAAFEPAWRRMGALFGAQAERMVEEAKRRSGADPPSVQELERTRSTLRRLAQSTTREVLGLALLTLVVVAVPIFFGWDQVKIAMASAVSLLTGVLTVLTWVREHWSHVQSFVDDYHGQLDRARDERAGEQGRALAAARERVERESADGLREAQENVERWRQRVGLSAKGRSLLDLLRDRLEGDTYDRRLGVLHQVQEDLAELTEALLPARPGPQHAALFPRGDPRVVLFIDDLDRCPPRRVVEVLEAVQLLVRTRLFVVVIAMDVRYVTRALEKVYEGILVRDGAPSGLDYIEKIVQVPYRVRPITPTALEGFLSQHMQVSESAGEPVQGAPGTQPITGGGEAAAAAGADLGALAGGGEATVLEGGQLAEAGGAGGEPGAAPGEVTGKESEPESPEASPSEQRPPRSPRLAALDPLPTTALDFLPEELEALQLACGDAQVSPRSAKRLVNVFKLMKIVWHRRSSRSAPGGDTKRAMALLLSLAARYPVVLRELLPALEGQFGEIEGTGSPSLPKLQRFLLTECDKGLGRLEAESPLRDEWNRCREILEGSACLDAGYGMTELGAENARLVSSFSFVSDPLWERQSELGEPLPQAEAGR